MSTNILGPTNHGSFSLGNGYSNGNYTAKFPLLNVAKPLWVSDFDIEPPRVKVDPFMMEIVEKINTALAFKSLKYESKDRKDWTLNEIMKSNDKEEGAAKAKLISDGRSAIISEVSTKLNRSSIDHTTKFLLSNESLYVYALSFVIYYEKVKDAEGINDRVIVLVENGIKAFFNILLAKATIEKKHLDLTEQQKEDIYKAVSHTNISYIKGAPAVAITKIISKYVDNGSIHRLVDKFFESGEIDPANGTPQIRQLMVNYLNEIGLIIPNGGVTMNYDDSAFTHMEGMEYHDAGTQDKKSKK